ncbi:uncharacterized protein [Spinacia oleracea]|uniref:c-Myc-binding protein n=1 Tax=Spinacia oleracea TaxID=3562 RepID=A0ABM3RR02_SPIOL|nr:uncharacterized protein LOC110799421 [Spinacia oleracea]
MQFKQEKEAKKEAFRKYLESSGVVDFLTKVLVSLYEQDNKPAFALEFVQQKLGGPTIVEYEKLEAEMSELQTKYNELVATHQETCKQLEHYKVSSTMTTSEDTIEGVPAPHKVNREGHN